MKKEEIYVSVESKEQAEMFRKLLEAMGEPLHNEYYPFDEETERLVIYNGKWLLSRLKEKHKQITFGDLVDLLQRKPLLISEDGVPLYEGDEFVFVNRAPKEGYYINDYHGKMYILSEESMCFKSSEKYLVFSSRQAALDWIEAQKPAETILFEEETVRVKVDANGFKCIAESDERTFKFSGEDLKKIYNAWQEHLPF
ncbi:MAG: hypothetical protein EOO20_10505 [Chryseobacterium sp.]|nr:MAG: hypothetical protein EOO20_10505 [Chryseobacterium sp.]